MRDTIIFRAFDSPSGGWGGTATAFLLLVLFFFLYWAMGKRSR